MRRIAWVLLAVAVLSPGFHASPVLAQCYVNCPGGDGTNLNPPAPPDHSPDLNSDGIVDIVDLALFAPFYGGPVTGNKCPDFNCDGMVNLIDLVTFAQHWGHMPGFPLPGGRPGYCI